MTSTKKVRTSYPFGLRVGLLGGGQLARMLAQKAQEMGLSVRVLCPAADEPAARVSSGWVAGRCHDSRDLENFLGQVDLATVESEFHSAELLREASEKTGTPIWPSPAVLGQLQDRWPQKQLLRDHKVPTADFIAVNKADDLLEAAELFDNRFVLKKRQGGYDGYGTFVVRERADLDKVFADLDPRQQPCIAERFIPFKRELALVAARNRRGQFVTLPLVQTHQVANRLDWLRGPVKHPALTALTKKLKSFLNKIDYTGVIAFELFDTGRELLVNEIAPRVHNSGHASLEALDVDQFTLHWRALLDLDLQTPEPLTAGFSMVNLIGAGGETPQAPARLSGHLHWYGKEDSRAGRKMGHVTYLGSKSDDGLKRAVKERKGFKL
ncbi:MAG: 5-(carboxyamino)imidazole ribonucleotide synthase [Bdellovibrionaceae bacterium]|nr:5-(carboxyamino)imidazole ribonucleotide synthase [Pseudobdellovibrionaceae bacterium]MBX3035169.1 5-(carboxyamino)imidazole ribonucleotide synthase [Pseudobdellovibrionaceae bacterium]